MTAGVQSQAMEEAVGARLLECCVVVVVVVMLRGHGGAGLSWLWGRMCSGGKVRASRAGRASWAARGLGCQVVDDQWQSWGGVGQRQQAVQRQRGRTAGAAADGVGGSG